MPRKLTEEQKARMRAGQEAARKRRADAAALAKTTEMVWPAMQSGEEKPEWVERPVPAAPTTEAAERRQRLLRDLDPETAALFTDAELAEIEREEQDKARVEARKRAMQDIRSAARQQARVEQDLIPASVLRTEEEQRRLNEPVSFRVRLPGAGSGDPSRGGNGFRVDGMLYQVGQTYTRPRAVFESLQSNHWRTWMNEIQFKTLDQHKPGNSALEILNQTLPQFEVQNRA